MFVKCFLQIICDSYSPHRQKKKQKNAKLLHIWLIQGRWQKLIQYMTAAKRCGQSNLAYDHVSWHKKKKK